MAQEYFHIFIFIIISTALSFIIFGASFAFARHHANSEKVSAYECGFNPFGDARSKFDVKFYLVAILFIIFDLEVSFLFPWAMALNKLTLFGFWTMIVFLGILTIGFVYEWKKGALDWD